VHYMQLSGKTFHLSTILFEKNMLPYIQSTSFEQLFAMTSSSSVVKCKKINLKLHHNTH